MAPGSTEDTPSCVQVSGLRRESEFKVRRASRRSAGSFQHLGQISLKGRETNPAPSPVFHQSFGLNFSWIPLRSDRSVILIMIFLLNLKPVLTTSGFKLSGKGREWGGAVEMIDGAVNPVVIQRLSAETTRLRAIKTPSRH